MPCAAVQQCTLLPDPSVQLALRCIPHWQPAAAASKLPAHCSWCKSELRLAAQWNARAPGMMHKKITASRQSQQLIYVLLQS